MDSSYAKLARAHEHLQEFEREAGAFMSATKRHYVLKCNPEKTSHWIVHWVDDPYPPLRLSTVLGDAAHNLRSSLDSLVCGLVRTQNAGSMCQGKWFPICTTREHYEATLKGHALAGVPADAIKIIESVQPYQRPDSTREMDPLYLLNAIDKTDKHRAAHLTTVLTTNNRLQVDGNDGMTYSIRWPGPIGSEFPTTIPLDEIPVTAFRDEVVGVRAGGRAVLTFRDQRGPWGDRGVVEIMTAVIKHVERVVEKFRPFSKFT